MASNWSQGKLSLYLLIALFAVAGINHFIMPDFYIPLIPYDHPDRSTLNIMAGLAEFGLAVGLVFKRVRKYAAYGVIALLIIFIPVHIIFIREGGCFEGYFCLPTWLAHLRLWIGHPLLIYWAWLIRKNPSKIV